MLGWKLFMRAARLLADNVLVALRVSALPYAVIVAVTFWFQGRYGDAFASLAGAGGTGAPADAEALAAAMPPGLAFALFLNLAVTALGGVWIAVGWHRFVLRGEEPPGWVPAFHGGIVLRYLGWSVLVGLMVALIVAAAFTMSSVLLLPLFGPAAGAVVAAVAIFVAAIFFYRLGIVLPARAVDEGMGFNAALVATRGHSRTCVTLAFVTATFWLLLQLPPLLDAGAAGGAAGDAAAGTGLGRPGPVGTLYALVIQWIELLLVTGTLTALYGHLVEGRPVE